MIAGKFYIIIAFYREKSNVFSVWRLLEEENMKGMTAEKNPHGR